MKILILSQVFWPDTASTAQHLSDLAFKLAEHHDVRIITSTHNYEDPRIRYPKSEIKNAVSIDRINNTALGKGNILSRVVEFFSFNFLLAFRLLRSNRKNTDIIIGLTSPPLVSFIGVLFAKNRRIPFYYWTMDLQPELSVSSGLLRERSLVARLFQKMGNYIFRNAESIIVLDKYMQEYVVRRGARKEITHVVPVWPVMEEIYEGLRGTNPFRVANGFGDRIVVMYSGNHSYIHPLDTLLQAALCLRDDPRFLFVFIGGGVRKRDVTTFRNTHELQAILQLDYQPRNIIHLSLSSADLQVVILGDKQVGFTHPNKIYGAMFVGKPILYIGPKPSHVTDIIDSSSGNIIVEHGDTGLLVSSLLAFAAKDIHQRNAIGLKNKQIAFGNFHPDILKARMCGLITNQ